MPETTQFVVLQPEYSDMFQKDAWFTGYLYKSGYFLCSKVETSEPYLCVTIEPLPALPSLGQIQAQLPHHAVSCIVGRFEEKSHGFVIPESSSDKDPQAHR